MNKAVDFFNVDESRGEVIDDLRDIFTDKADLRAALENEFHIYDDYAEMSEDEFNELFDKYTNDMVKSSFIANRFYNNSESLYSLSELSQYIAVFYFNMRTVHFNTAGENFLELHEYAQELYEQAEDYYDDLVETAMSFNETIQPMFVTPGDWSPTNEVPYNSSSSISIMTDSVKILYDYLESIAKEVYPSFVYSKIDSMLEWLDKQNYKLTQMSKEI